MDQNNINLKRKLLYGALVYELETNSGSEVISKENLKRLDDIDLDALETFIFEDPCIDLEHDPVATNTLLNIMRENEERHPPTPEEKAEVATMIDRLKERILNDPTFKIEE